MTAQINDIVFHSGTKFAITAIAGSGLFEPCTYGFKPKMMHTACRRGYYLQYQIVNGQLLLAKATINLTGEEEITARKELGPLLFGKIPSQTTNRNGWDYDGLEQPIGFSGGILLGSDFIDDLYVHMGFQYPWKYRLLFEAIFEWGRLLECHDRSAAMAVLRSDFKHQLSYPELGLGGEKFKTAFDKCFSLNYTT